MAIFLNSYRPLIETKGWRAAEKYSLPPYIDGSIRREPDFEAEYPSVTALCRGRNFAPHRREGDIIVYLTAKSPYLPDRRLVAMLRVLHRKESHADGARFYHDNNLPLPKNCMIKGNAPAPYEQSSRYRPDAANWEQDYQSRAERYPVFLICEAIYRELHQPPIVPDEILRSIFGRIPCTQNPPLISKNEANSLLNITSIDFSMCAW